jgi:hypothetical protein
LVLGEGSQHGCCWAGSRPRVDQIAEFLGVDHDAAARHYMAEMVHAAFWVDAFAISAM